MIRDSLKPILACLTTAAQNRAAAADLRTIADERDRIADALERDQRRPATKRMAPRHGGGGRPSIPWVGIETSTNRRAVSELRVLLSRSIYNLAGNPLRLDPQRVDDGLILVPVRGDAGYQVIANKGGVWINASGARDVVALDNGRYEADVRSDGVIVIGSRFEG